jgi:replicative DNA helicase
MAAKNPYTKSATKLNEQYLMPSAVTVEAFVLGVLMMEKNTIDVVSDLLHRECFYLDAHQKVFGAITSLAIKNISIDEIAVMQELIKSGDLESVGGPVFLTGLTGKVTSSSGLESKCRIVLEKFMKRELIRIGNKSIAEGLDETIDTFEAINNVEKEMTGLTTGHHAKTYSPISAELVKRLQRIAELRKQKRHVTGVHTGFMELDRVTHGWQPTDLIILAARPSVGKTAFALNLARNAAMHGERPVPVGIFSLEMSTGQLTDRLLSADSEILLDKITNGQMGDDDFQKLNESSERISSAGIYIDDTAAVNVFQLRSKARTMKRKHGIGLIIIDYLQLMSGMEDRQIKNREQEISTISRQLKILAKELEVPIIALSQLSRQVENRKGDNKMPQLSDLRDSGAIEQDADMVMFLYRPEYHGMDSNEMGESTKGETHLKIAKHRNGSLELLKFEAKLWCQKFVPMDYMAAPKELGKGSWKPLAQELFKENDLEI